LLRDRADRDTMIAQLADAGILAPFHYVPLHSSPAGTRYGRTHGALALTTSVSERLVRLPLYIGLETEQAFVIDRVTSFLRN
jgi:dTDP-4-amino-4,6-dideoxygalactose transaminase